MNLLYRGGRDGFRAADFHRLCDDKSNTLVLVQTTKDYIFGGYTNACWDSFSGFKNDSGVFIFSLVNKLKRPFLIKNIEKLQGIWCNNNCGPIIGDWLNKGISIEDKCNESTESSAKLLEVHVFDDFVEPEGYYFCDSGNFQVKEIEVFQVTTN